MKPADLPAPDDPALTPEQYQLIVAPALQVMAELAVVRGDFELYNDMACMLGLRALIARLADCYLDEAGTLSATGRAALAGARDAASTLVLQRSPLDAKQLSDCIWALNEAERQLEAAQVFGAEREAVDTAWREFADGTRERAIGQLKLAGGTVVTAIDNWERARFEARQDAPS